MATHGVVWRVGAKGVIVALLGEVRGLVPASELRASLGAVWEADPHSCYREGQVLTLTLTLAVQVVGG